MMSIGKNWDAVIVTGFILIRIGYQNHKLAALERHISHNFFPNTQGQGVQGEVKKKHSKAGLMALNKRGGSYCSDFWHEGQRYRKSWGARNKRVALEKDAEFKVKVYEGKYHKKSKHILFEVFSAKYLENARLNKRKSSARRMAHTVNRHQNLTHRHPTYFIKTCK